MMDFICQLESALGDKRQLKYPPDMEPDGVACALTKRTGVPWRVVQEEEA